MSTNMFVNGAKSFDEVAVVGENGFAGEGAKVAESKEGNATSLSRTVGCLPRNYLKSPEAKQNYDVKNNVKNKAGLETHQPQNDKTVNLQNAAENAQKSEGPVATQGKDIQSDNSVQATTAVTVQGAKPEGFKAKMIARLRAIEDFINSILIALHIKKAPNSEPTNPAPLLNTNQPIPQEAIDQRLEVEEPMVRMF